jgi:TolA-binding protein
MSCSHDNQLLDLVLGEIPAEDAAALRAEALECPHCHEALAQLEMGAALAARMPMEEPPSSMNAVIMAAAREKAEAMAGERAKVAPAAEEVPGEAEAPTTLWGRIKKWVSGITLGPQLAMASVMVLVVSIGLFYLPKGGGDTVARTAVTPDPEGEAISALPAEEASMDPSDPEAPQAALEVGEPEADRNDGEGPGVYGADNRPAASGRFRDDRDLAERQRERLARANEPEPEPSVRPPSTPRQQQTARSEARSTRLSNDEPLPTFEGDVATNAGVPAPAGVPSEPTSQAPARGSASSYEQGVGSYRGGNYREAEDELLDAVEDERPDREVLPNAVHQLARSYRQRNDCQNAVTHYSDLFQRFPSYAQLPQALVEAADCQRRLGRLRQARTLLERAQRYASTRAVASRELQRIETLERASRRRASPAAADSYEAAEAY